MGSLKEFFKSEMNKAENSMYYSNLMFLYTVPPEMFLKLLGLIDKYKILNNRAMLSNWETFVEYNKDIQNSNIYYLQKQAYNKTLEYGIKNLFDDCEGGEY